MEATRKRARVKRPIVAKVEGRASLRASATCAGSWATSSWRLRASVAARPVLMNPLAHGRLLFLAIVCVARQLL